MMKAKKSLGQNFLKSSQIVGDIVDAAKIEKTDTVLEIGPGLGVLTKALLETGAHIVCIEKDDRLIPELNEMFAEKIASHQLEIVHGDVLDLTHETLPPNYKVVANIPYYITGQIIRMFLEMPRQPTSMTLLVQKEVAERMVARDGKESILSLSVKVFGKPTYVRTVGRGAFSPQPNVDSAVVHIAAISHNMLKGTSAEKFFSVVHAGFAHKRKQILPNLALISSKEKVVEALARCDISPLARAEDVPLEKWVRLSEIL